MARVYSDECRISTAIIIVAPHRWGPHGQTMNLRAFSAALGAQLPVKQVTSAAAFCQMSSSAKGNRVRYVATIKALPVPRHRSAIF